MDDLTPMNSEYREIPSEQPAQTPHYYGTGRQPRRRSDHVPLVILVIVLVIAANLLTITTILWLRGKPVEATLESQDDKISISIGNAQQSTEDTQQLEADESELNIQTVGSRQLTAAEIYRQIQPSLTQIEAGDASATGVILTEDGYILTNAAALAGISEPTVTLSDGTVYRAQLVGSDGLTDLAILKIEAEGLTAAPLGNGDGIQAGDEVYCMSYPFGGSMQPTLTRGIVSSVSSVTVSGAPVQALQTDAALAGAGSGGPIINSCGQVVALHVGHLGEYASYETVAEIGFALPVSQAESFISQLINYGYVQGRASLGIEVAELTESQRRYWDLPQGVIVSEIQTDSNAFRAGLRAGDVLIQLGDEMITDEASYYNAINSIQAGDRVYIVAYRRGVQLAGEIVMDEASE